MKTLMLCALGMATLASSAWAQSFQVTGTPIPTSLLEQTYGKMPKGVGAYDLNICNISPTKQSVVSSQIYQALAQENVNVQPVGRQIMLAAIMRNQSRTTLTILNVAIGSASGVLSVLASSKFHVPSGLVTGAALGAISMQQIMQDIKPVLPADKLQAFENQVLESALVMDSGSCVERTVFTLAQNPKLKASAMTFHVR